MFLLFGIMLDWRGMREEAGGDNGTEEYTANN
jgi:hypothetical protein